MSRAEVAALARRRDLLASALAAGIVAPAAIATAMESDPDAELIQAWQDYLAAYRAMDQSEDATGGPEWDLQERWNEAEARILELPARGLRGAIVKLRIAVLRDDSDCVVQQHYAYGKALPPDEKIDLEGGNTDKHAAVWIAFDVLRELEAVTDFQS
jgi:hypothetical protein